MKSSLVSEVAPKVLVVDDERIIAQTLALVLRQNGFDPTAETNPEKALERAEYWPPDSVLTDLVMPEMDGLQLAERICSKHPGCRVVILTAYHRTSDEILETCRQEGRQFRWIPKPVHPLELVAALRSTLQKGREIRADSTALRHPSEAVKERASALRGRSQHLRDELKRFGDRFTSTKSAQRKT